MDKNTTLERITSTGLLAILRGPSQELALQMVEALVEGGVTGIEITYTTPGAIEVVKELGQKYGAHILLGMGTLTEARQADEAREAGAGSELCPASLALEGRFDEIRSRAQGFSQAVHQALATG